MEVEKVFLDPELLIQFGTPELEEERKDRPMEFFCHLGRTFTLDEFEDHADALRKSMTRKLTQMPFVSEINLSPVSDSVELECLAGLSQFYRIPNKVLFKLVRVATGIEVRDRWVAVRTIMVKRIPIPVPLPLPEVRQG
jgi:hypothetical protein